MTEKEKVEIVTPIKHANIYAALSAFQGELKPMAKTGTVEFETSKGKVKFDYTPLGEIMNTIYPLLAKHGLSVRHEISEKGVEAILTHETFEYQDYDVMSEINSQMIQEKEDRGESKPVITIRKIPSKNELRSGTVKITYGAQMKDTGAAITYARRYTLTMVLGISSEDDKDAELLEQSAKNAIQYAQSRAKKGIEEAKTVAAIDKALVVINKDIESLKAGKAPALGLTMEQYQDLVLFAEERKIKVAGQEDIAA